MLVNNARRANLRKSFYIPRFFLLMSVSQVNTEPASTLDITVYVIPPPVLGNYSEENKHVKILGSLHLNINNINNILLIMLRGIKIYY